ncbi:30S ribosomal protein S6, partial [Enterobacter hormaechei]|nr:30S ribosomal protein S6 [Enterobacter hormaechei]
MVKAKDERRSRDLVLEEDLVDDVDEAGDSEE